MQIFWPIALIPCFMADCKNKSQMAVYGYPAGGAPVAMPTMMMVMPPMQQQQGLYYPPAAAAPEAKEV